MSEFPDLLEQVRTLDFPAPLPEKLLAVEQTFDAPYIEDVAATTRHTLEQSNLLHQIEPGDTVAVGAGSRGIANIAVILREVIDRLKKHRAKPFVFPAMGSHGGATAEGQRTVLAQLGITPDSMGVEIRSSMEATQIGQIPNGPPLFQDMNAASADHTLLVNRVKPHTDFRSTLESGLTKMTVIGMGKQKGAATIHAYGAPGFQRFLAPAARIYERNTNLLGGIAIIENAHDETAEIVALSAAEVGGPKEEKLLERAKSLMASLPFPEIDVLVLRQIGKNVSGTGMDTNIVGRLMIPRQPENFGGPDVAVIAVLDLTPETHGNATGIGLANLITTRLVRKIDWATTYTNAITSGIFGMYRAAMPITLLSDHHVLQVAMRGCARPSGDVRMVLIHDTLALNHLWVSPNLRAQVESHPRLCIVEEVPLAFDSAGSMTCPWQLD